MGKGWPDWAGDEDGHMGMGSKPVDVADKAGEAALTLLGGQPCVRCQVLHDVVVAAHLVCQT